MKDELLEEINQLKKELVVSFTKYSLSGGEEENIDAVLNSILLGWLDSIHNYDDFRRRYDAFQRLKRVIYQSGLFEISETLSYEKEKNESQIKHAVSIYKSLIQNEEYKNNSSLCGYQLPIEFGDATSYYGNVLRLRIQFYQLFSEKLEEIHRSLLKKGGNYR